MDMINKFEINIQGFHVPSSGHGSIVSVLSPTTGNVIGSRPTGLTAPNSTSAHASPVAWPTNPSS